MVISSLAPEVEARLEPLALEVMLRACDAYTEYLYDDVCMKVTLECSPGHYLVRNNKTNECIPCPRGTFKEGVNNRDVCDRCPAQSEFQSTGATSLSQCRCVCTQKQQQRIPPEAKLCLVNEKTRFQMICRQREELDVGEQGFWFCLAHRGSRGGRDDAFDLGLSLLDAHPAASSVLIST